MASKQTIDFKDPLWIISWLDTALKKEKEKYKTCPVMPDMVPGYDAAQGWGYVVVGYFLVEEAFKALLFVRGKSKVPTTHSLSKLFVMLDADDQSMLQEFYDDYKSTIGGTVAAFPFKSLYDFLLNLDGDKNTGGRHIGSVDWRYYLIEKRSSRVMPTVSVDYLHEIVYGTITILESATVNQCDPTRFTRSWRLQRQRARKYRDWLTVRINSDGWDKLGDRLEILWGPDHLDRYDLYLFQGKGIKPCFSQLPDDFAFPVIDKRKEIEGFDAEQGLRSIGIIRTSRPSVK